ncbi:MAG: hypothetical protein RDU59_05865 [Thermodesulfobacteriota bacterium]|nr:hypothetical protein [Thermodesulfobacteriota bacterium]
MKVYEITVKPVSGFGTPLKGDTIFGHFCWQIAYDKALVRSSIDAILSSYHTMPFAVFSSAYPKLCIGTQYHYVLRTPSLPIEKIFTLPDSKCERIRTRKAYKSKVWMVVPEGGKFSSLKELEFLSDQELLDRARANVSEETKRHMRRRLRGNFTEDFRQFHNTIDRLTGTTGEGRFVPFMAEQRVYYPETELAVFVGIDETVLSIEQVMTGLQRIGDLGFGRDASTGCGRFEICDECEINLSEMGSGAPNACYTLGPCVPENDTFTEMLFTPFTRFGRHGDVLAKSVNPFKNPIIMADEGGVFKPKIRDVFKKPYIGSAVRGISKAQSEAVSQGYSLYIPVNVEV